MSNPYTQLGLQAARERGMTADAVRGLNYVAMCELCGVELDADGKHLQCPAWSYENERRKIARVLESDAALASYDDQFADLESYFGWEIASDLLGPRPQEATL